MKKFFIPLLLGAGLLLMGADSSSPSSKEAPERIIVITHCYAALMGVILVSNHGNIFPVPATKDSKADIDKMRAHFDDDHTFNLDVDPDNDCPST